MTVTPWWSLHSHSKYSSNDALPEISDMVDRAVLLGYPALGLTDHGNVNGSVQLYRACRKAGIEPLPGEEFYITPDRMNGSRSNYHITIASFTEQGYRNLVGLHNMAQTNYYFKPRIDLADIAGLAEQGKLAGLVASSGCYFGLVMQTLEKRGPVACSRLLEALAGWFPRFYVELHNHGVTHDDGSTDLDFVRELVVIADGLGLPYIIAQDSHYLVHEDQKLHDALKALVSWSDDPSEAQFPGGPYSMVDRNYLATVYPADVLDRACDNLFDLSQRAHLRLPELEKFSMRIPDVTLTGDADTELAMKVTPSEPMEQVQFDRLADELDIITASGFAGYLLLVADVCQFMKSKGIWFITRGSASGSYVCYLLGITQIDPIKGDLRMDRFMSRDRQKPPDVDLDVEHERRDEVVEYLSRRFTVRQIGSHMKYSITEEEEASSDSDEDAEVKGSLMVRYFSTARKRGQTVNSWREIPRSDQKMLQTLGNMKLISQSGTHAAGYIVSPDELSAQQLPMAWIASRKAFVTSYPMKDVEALGFVKLDLLGLRTMTAIKITCNALGWTQSDFENIPLNDPVVYKTISAGKTAGMFQLDGKATRHGCMDLRPTKFGDIVAAQALFRPATMNSGATRDYIARRRKTQPVPVRHPDIQAETHDTYGVLLYQEQVIGVLRRMGMDADELSPMLSAIKASNELSAGAKVALEAVKPRIRELATDRGWDEPDIDWLLDALVAYGEYSFNKCATGDAVLLRSAGGNGQKREITLKEFHNVWHGTSTPQRAAWRRRGIQIMARDTDGRIRPDYVTDVQYQGVRPVWTVTTDSGHSITTTGNHRHLTDRGWVTVNDLKDGDSLAIMGPSEQWMASQSTGNPPSVKNGLHLLRKQIRDLGQCEVCGQAEGRLEIAHLDHDRSNNDRSNLRLLCNSCHKKHDWATGRRKTRHSRGRAVLLSPITSIVAAGEQPVYDLSMAGEDHSFIANGIVTHNSHAASYGLTAYRTAWLSVHKPTEYWLGLVTAFANHAKEKMWVEYARKAGVLVLPAHVNSSGITYSLIKLPTMKDPDKQAIRRGLVSIKGIGLMTSHELVARRPFASLTDLALRVIPRKVSGSKALGLGIEPEDCGGAISALYEYGALDGLELETIPEGDK